MLEISSSSLPENPIEQIEEGGTGSNGPVSDGFKEEEHGEEANRNSTANRWPREETMALLRIRSDMDAAFRDISPKAPLWEQVSRKLAELGYHRSAKKCKEKFENIYKYHRRTKEGRRGSGRPKGKTYRFFEQLEALQSHPLPLPPPPPPPAPSTEEQLKLEEGSAKTTTPQVEHVSPDNNVIQDAVPCSIRFPSSAVNMVDHSGSSTTSSSSKVSREKNKRKLTRFFERLMKEVIERQETLQRKFMEVLDKCEQDRIAREEAWKREELARIKRERELLAEERSIAAAKDAAVLAFLKKFTQHAHAGPEHWPEDVPIEIESPVISNDKDKNMQENNVNYGNGGCATVAATDKQECTNVNGVGSFIQMSSTRWPKEEVEALIRLRTELDAQSQGNGAKGPLWEEISSAMKNLGYDRSAKRCKEKWENINKYFKRIREKNKRKPEDSKTCPYFHQLDALYSKKPKHKVDESAGSGSGSGSVNELKPEELLMHIMGSQEERQQQLESSSEDADGENTDQIIANSPSIAIMG